MDSLIVFFIVKYPIHFWLKDLLTVQFLLFDINKNDIRTFLFRLLVEPSWWDQGSERSGSVQRLQGSGLPNVLGTTLRAGFEPRLLWFRPLFSTPLHHVVVVQLAPMVFVMTTPGESRKHREDCFCTSLTGIICKCINWRILYHCRSMLLCIHVLSFKTL